MRLIGFADGRAGVLLGEEILDIRSAKALIRMLDRVPETVRTIIASPDDAIRTLKQTLAHIVADPTVQSDLRRLRGLVPMRDASLGTPLPDPGLILAAGMNYVDHLEEMGTPRPAQPYSFTKAPSSIIGDGEDILLPPDHDTMVDWEAELAVVIGQVCHRVSVEEATAYIFGYMCANDVSARDWVDLTMRNPGTMEPITNWSLNLLGKQYPTFCPLGPVLVTADEISDPANLEISCRVNGKVMQHSNTAKMAFSTAELISFLSQSYRLMPGDVILTGTMGGVGIGRSPRIFLKRGDVVEVEIAEVGVITNRVR